MHENYSIKQSNFKLKKQEHSCFWVFKKLKGKKVSLLSFVNNERMVLKQKLENKINKKEPIKKGINILEGLISEIAENGEIEVLEKYQKKG